jgi:hypothetical protein
MICYLSWREQKFLNLRSVDSSYKFLKAMGMQVEFCLLVFSFLYGHLSVLMSRDR